MSAGKKAKAVALCCLLPLLLLGCGKQEESILYNSFDHNWAVTERYEVVEHSFQQFSLYDRETGTFQTFPAGAFADSGRQLWASSIWTEIPCTVFPKPPGMSVFTGNPTTGPRP